jgi:tetratricopeptide (TPR) repeat protein
MPELLFDFNHLLQTEPDDATAYGLRGQVQLRRALRARARGAPLELRTSLELATQEFTSALTVRPDLAAAHVNRGACRTQLARVLAAESDPERSLHLLQEALADYDAALRVEPDLAVAWFDRALVRLQRAALARAAFHPSAQGERQRAREDARRALDLAGEEHPWRWRFPALVDELG